MSRPMTTFPVLVKLVRATSPAFLALSVWASAAWAADGVPGGTEKLQKSHRQATSVALRDSGSGATLQDFCLDRNGMVVALLAKNSALGTIGKLAGQDATKSQVRILDRDGKLVRNWDVDFAAQAINCAPDGSIYVAGNGRVANFDSEGKSLRQEDAPQVALLKDEDELREAAKAQIESEKESTAEQIKNMELILKDPKQIEALQEQYDQQLEQQEQASQAKVKDTAEAGEKPKKARKRPTIDVKKLYEQQLEYYKVRKDVTVEQMMASISAAQGRQRNRRQRQGRVYRLPDEQGLRLRGLAHGPRVSESQASHLRAQRLLRPNGHSGDRRSGVRGREFAASRRPLRSRRQKAGRVRKNRPRGRRRGL